MSKAQELARQRNSHGGLLKGIIINLDSNIRQSCISGTEEQQLNDALKNLKRLHADWGGNYENFKDERL